MASNSVVLKGTTYNGVSSLEVPVSGGGTALFTDVSDTTAAAADVASGKYFYDALGAYTAGTASGGGGSNFTLLATASYTINTTSTSSETTGNISCGSEAVTKDAIIWVHVRGRSGKRSGYYYGSDAFFINYPKANGNNSSLSTSPFITIYVGSDGLYAAVTGTRYGVVASQLSADGIVKITQRYNATNSQTINDTFDVQVYKLSMPTGVTLFA